MFRALLNIPLAVKHEAYLKLLMRNLCKVFYLYLMQIKVPIVEQFRIQIYIKLQCDLVMNDCQCDERLYN